MTNTNQELNQLTKESLKLALLQMLEESSIDQINVTALTKRAGVSRMAYYRNYPSVTALYHDLYEDYFKQFFASTSHYLIAQDYKTFFEAIFNFILTHQKDAKILLSSKENGHFLERLNQTFCDPLPDARERYFFRGIMGFVFNILTEWVHHDFDLSVEELANICVTLSQISENAHDNAVVKKYFS